MPISIFQFRLRPPALMVFCGSALTTLQYWKAIILVFPVG